MTRALMLMVWLWASVSLAAAGLPPASEPVARGAAIAAAAQSRDDGFGQSVTRVEMVLSNAEGRTRTRELTSKTLEAAEGDRSLIVFHEPPDIAGTALLSLSRPEGDDYQWLYLPALKRVKRIAAGNRSGSFVGSEFSYEDLLPEQLEDFDHRWLRDEGCGPWQCYVLERRPRYPGSGYSRQTLWLDAAEYRLVKVDYYDPQERLGKTLMADDYRPYLDRYWRAHTLVMRNHLTGKETRLAFSAYDFTAELTERDFEPAALERLR